LCRNLSGTPVASVDIQQAGLGSLVHR
jgi:hypothetical protein